MGFLEALTGDDPASHYAEAYKAADLYVMSLLATDPPTGSSSYSGNAQAEALLLQLKRTAGPWVNNAAPHCKELPSDIVAWDPDLERIIEFVERLAGQPITDPLKNEIVNAMTSALGILSPTGGVIAGLVKTLGTLSTGLSADSGSLATFRSELGSAVSAFNSELATLQARLASVKSAHCPNPSEIKSLMEKIGETKRELAGADAWATVLERVANDAKSATPSVQYLTIAWQTFEQEVTLCIKVASLIRADPARLTTFEINYLSTAWDAVKQRMAAIVAQLG